MEIPEEKILNVKNKPRLEGKIELKTLEDLSKLVKVGNLVCLYVGEKGKIYFIQDFFYKE